MLSRDPDRPVVLLDFKHGDDYLLPQRLVRDFAPELLWGPDWRVVLPVSLNWILVQFEGSLELGLPKPGLSFQGAPPRRPGTLTGAPDRSGVFLPRGGPDPVDC